MGWDVPVFAHIPLIHGTDGKKLSKRHGAVGLEDYRAMGYPASGMRNYLTRLGWSHGDDEIFDDQQAQAWFGLEGIGRAPARLDFKKLENVCGHHIAAMTNAALMRELRGYLAATGSALPDGVRAERLEAALPLVKARAKTFPQLLDHAHFALAERPVAPDEKAARALDSVSRSILAELTPHLQNASWTRDTLETKIGDCAARHGIGLGKIAQPLRAALAGRSASPSVFDMMLVLGRAESLARIGDAAA